jgi:uncharacterized damage-inducible protein DinB
VSELDTIRDWFEYNAHARRGYLEVLAKLPKEELSRDRGASSPTLLDILAHSAGDAISFWIGRASIDRANPPPLDKLSNPSLEEVRRYVEAVNIEAKRFLDGLTERDLDRTFRIPKGGAFPRDLVLSVRDMLWHLVEEELQHRGELNALLWQLDVDPPIFDWIDWVSLPGRRQTVGRTHPSGR